MSAFRKLVINCGVSHVSFGLFSVDSTGVLSLEDFGTEDLPYDLSNEASWLPSTLSSVKSLAKTNRLSGPVTLVSSGANLLLKSVKSPVVGADRQQQTITYEVSRNLPYDLADVVWDKHVVKDDGVEQELLVAAMRVEQSNQLASCATGAGLFPEAITAGPAVDVNAVRLALRDEPQDVLFLNIGAKSTTLAFITPDDYSIRSIQTGGNTVTQSLADSLARPFDVAEKLKLAFLSGSSTAADAQVEQMVTAASQNFIRKLLTDLTRAIAIFRRQRPNSQLSKILLTGRGSLLPGLSESLAEKIGAPVEYFNAAACLKIGSKVNQTFLDNNFLRVSELVGAVSGQLLPNGIKLNLLPTSIVKGREDDRRKPFYYTAAALLVVAGVLPVLKTNSALAETRKAYSALNEKVAPLKANHEEIIKLTAESAASLKKTEGLRDLVASKNNWPNFLSDLQGKLIEVGDVWLDDLQVLRSTPADPVVGTEEPDPDKDKKPRPVYKLKLKGTMIDRDHPISTVSPEIEERATKLLESIKSSPFIKAVEGKKLDSKPGLLLFEIILEVDSQKRL